MHPRLIEDHMRKFGQVVFDVLNPAAAGDVLTLLLVGFPERRFIDPVRFLQHAFAETKGLEHLHRPAGDAVGLAEAKRTILLLDDTGLDVGKGRQLRSQRQARRPAADDQDVDLLGKSDRGLPFFGLLRGLRLRRVTGLKPFKWNCIRWKLRLDGPRYWTNLQAKNRVVPKKIIII